MRRTAGLVVVGGMVAILACDATSPVTPPEQPVTPPGQPATSLTPAIAFESDRDGSSYIYVANEDGSGVTRLVPGETPAWSHDGSRIAYFWGGDDGHPGGIYVINPDGSQERSVASASDYPSGGVSWGPGDREIAYRGGDGIYAIAADGSTTPRKLIGDDLALPRPEGWDPNAYDPGWVGQPVWSPDGDKIVLLRFDPYSFDWGGASNWYVIGADGSNPRLLGAYWSCKMPPPGRGTVPCRVNGLAWSPPGASLAVASDGVLGIVPASFDPDSGVVDVTYQVQVPGGIGDPQWSPDGSAIVFDAYAGPPGSRILVLSLDSPVVKQLIPEVTNPVLPAYSDRRPVWRRVPDCTACWDY